MKKLLYISCSMVLVSLGACNKFLDQTPVSSVQTNNFYTNTNDFLQAVNGVYNRLRGYPTQAMWMREMRSDNVVITTDGNRDFQGINDFSPNLTTTAFVVGAWNNDFNGIYNANNVLDALVSKSSNIPDAALAKRFTAECRFLRAFFYFDLLRYFGKLPIVDKVLSPAEVANVPRSDVKDVYDFIVADLQYAITNLPASYAAADIGRPTLYAAKGLLGLVYLTKSGPAYGITGGPGIDSKEYDKALAQFNDIVAGNQFVFSTDYPSIFSYTNENNKEVLFDIQFMTTSNGADFPSQLVPAAYFTGLGLSGYDNAYGSSTYNVSKDLLQSFRGSAGTGVVDKRDTFSIQHGFALSTATPTVLDTSRPFEKKYISIAKRGTGRADWPINFIVMRYTDVLMMRAECILHGATGTQAEVDAIVNKVRARGGISATAVNVNLATLMEERRREFVGEGLRWDDLVREGMAVTTMNAWIASDGIITINKVIPQYIIYPVPQAELLAKPGLYTQNDGYY
jgi:hypothetical protein